MNWWNVLEISQDSDLKTIKKAYAKLLKIHNPEDDALGYQRIREAYEQGVKYVKKNNINKKVNELNSNQPENVIDEANIDKKSIEENLYEEMPNKARVNAYVDYINESENKIENDINEDKKNKFKVDSYIDYINYKDNKANDEKINVRSNLEIINMSEDGETSKIDLDKQVNIFLERLNKIYNDISLRINSEVWDELLNSDVIWNINAIPTLEDKMFDFLINHKYLPAEIWTKLNNNFSWSKNEIELYEKYSKEHVDELLFNLKEPNKLKYDYIRTIDIKIADKYLYEREMAYIALENKEYAEAYEHLNNANCLFGDDAELLRLMGNYYYDIDNMAKALQFYKSAYEINNQDMISALRIGIILVLDKSFNKALPYLKTFLSYNNNDKLALDYAAFCYYYSNDLLMAKEYFTRLLILDENNDMVKEYIENITAKLQGERAKKIRFNKNNLIEEVVPKKEISIKRTVHKKVEEKESKASRNYRIVIAIITAISLGALRYGLHDIIFQNSSNNNIAYEDKVNNKENSKENKKENDNSSMFTKINSVSQFIDTDFNTNIKITLTDVKPIKYYKISEPFENRVIFSENELDQKGLRDKVEGQLYVGFFDNYNIFFFVDPKCSNETIKNSKYEVNGSKYGTSDAGFDTIEKEYASAYKNYIWVTNGFIDASQTEIDKAQKNSESIKQVGDKKVKILESAQDFKDSRFSGDVSIHLANIIPLDLYLCKYDDINEKIYSKKEMQQQNLWNKQWVQAYSGTIDNVNIMFFDKDFSKDSITSDGEYAIQGRKYMYCPDEITNVRAEEGQSVDKVGIYGCYIDNSGTK